MSTDAKRLPVLRALVCGALMVLACALFAPETRADAAADPAHTARILYFSSFPEIMQDGNEPGLAALATAVQLERAKTPDLLFINGGASLGPSVLGAMDNGAHMVDILNAMGPDLMAVGKKEFSYGYDNLILAARAATFPFITSNLVDATTGAQIDALEPTAFLASGGLRIGVLAVTSPNAIEEYGAREARALEERSTVRNRAAALRAEGADAVILLADTDYDDLGALRAAGTVDVIFYTHNFANPYSLDNQGALHSEGPLDGKFILLDLWFEPQPDGGKKLRTKATFRDLSDYAPAPDIAGLVQSYQTRLRLLLEVVVATTDTAFDTLRARVRTRENAFGNLVADALKDQMKADITLLNSGSIRGNRSYAVGDTISRGDIQREVPFGNRTVLVSLTGAQISAALEHSLECGVRVDGCFLQFSGLEVRYDSQRPPHARLLSVQAGGAALAPDRLYRVALPDFLANGNDGFTMFRGAEHLPAHGSNRLIWDVVAEYIGNQKRINPQPEGRLVDVAAQRQTP